MTTRPSPRLPLAPLSAALALVLATAPARSEPTTPAPAVTAEPPRVDLDSPRVTWQGFAKACRAGHYAEASKWLDLPKSTSPEEAAKLAFELDAVLRRYTTLEDDDFSPLAEGDGTDSLGVGIDEVARIPHPGSQGGHGVRLVRRNEDGAARWVFSRPTVRSIHVWYETLEDRWIRPLLPVVLLREGPLGLLLWQWLALAFGVPALVTIGRGVAVVFVKVARRLLVRLYGETDQLPSIVAPLQYLAAALGALSLVRFLALDPESYAVVRGAIVSTAEVSVLWMGARSVDIVVNRASHTTLGHLPLFEAGLLPLITKMSKLALVIVGVIVTLSNLGYQVGSLLAGLGIGGLAFALAAQKTVENLFGAAAIGLDQPFRIGDPVNIDGVKGVVEAVGIRSTRIRTESRSVVSMPNAKVAEMRIENSAARDRFLLAASLPIPLSAAGKLPKLLEELDELVAGHPDRRGDGHAATIARIGASGFEVELKGYFHATDAVAFERVRHHLFLRVVAVLESFRIELTPSGGVFRLEGSFDKASTTEAP